MQNNLLAIDEVITKARKSGATLGHGDPKIHLAYLTRLRLLPQTIRRKIGNKIVGCYPEYVIPLLKKIEELKTSGLTYNQIRYQINQSTTINKLPIYPAFSPSYLPTFSPATDRYSPIVFLLIGLALGFLVAVYNNNGGTVGIKSAQTANLPPETNSQPIIRVVESSNSPSDPIYLIAIPNQNLYKLGKTDINLLK